MSDAPHAHGPGCGHAPVGDPRVQAWLREVVGRLRRAQHAGDDTAIQAIVDEAGDAVLAIRQDPNPRARAQARGLLAVFELVRAGDRELAAELLDGELLRSFPGEASLDAVPPNMLP